MDPMGLPQKGNSDSLYKKTHVFKGYDASFSLQGESIIPIGSNGTGIVTYIWLEFYGINFCRYKNISSIIYPIGSYMGFGPLSKT